MDKVLPNILSILTTPPGNLIVHLVLAFSVLATLQAALISRRMSRATHTGRLIFGLGMLLAGQMILFAASGLAWQGLVNSRLVMPPLDRAVVLFSLVWIVWLWTFPQPARLGDLVTGFLNLGVILLFIFTFTSWSATGAADPFNNTWIDLTWELAAMFIVLTGMLILLFSRPAGWEFGLGMLLISLGGVVSHLALNPNGGDFSGFIRLSQLAAYPLLANLLNRLAPVGAADHPAEKATQPVKEVKKEEITRPTAEATGSAANSAAVVPTSQPRAERRRYSSDSRTVHAWLELNSEKDPAKAATVLVKAISHTMLADITFLVSGPMYGQIVLHDGYDLVREDVVEGLALDPGQMPMLANALERSKYLRITTSESQSNDLRAISSALGLKDGGSLMFIPLQLNEKPWGGIMLLSPYSNRQWTVEDQAYLSGETAHIAEILQNAKIQIENSLSARRAEDQLVYMQTEVERLRQENMRLASAGEQRAAASETPGLPAQLGSDVKALVALQQEAQEIIRSLQAENEQLHKALVEARQAGPASPQEISAAGAGGADKQAQRLEADLRATLLELAHLQNELAKSNAAVLMLQRAAPQPSLESAEDREVIAAISQEIRQPMSSILGYTDLLLTESVGILGALQRKFLERIRASTERMRSMLDDLIHVAALGDGSLELLPKPVELGTIIDGAMADTSAQLREKNITLRVDLPAELPRIYADRDALQQIIVHLLQNAGSATPAEGMVKLRARIQQQSDEMYLLLQVTDSGGGIQPDQIARVFNRRLRADNPLIQGVGDTGVGLSIAKTLTEAHGGRIWVDTEAGQSTSFSVLLPLRQVPVETARK